MVRDKRLDKMYASLRGDLIILEDAGVNSCVSSDRYSHRAPAPATVSTEVAFCNVKESMEKSTPEFTEIMPFPRWLLVEHGVFNCPPSNTHFFDGLG